MSKTYHKHVHKLKKKLTSFITFTNFFKLTCEDFISEFKSIEAHLRFYFINDHDNWVNDLNYERLTLESNL